MMQKDYPCHLLFVGDEAFALSEHVLRPHPNRRLTFLKHKYITTGCQEHEGIAQCAFGILANKWRIFHRPIDVKPDLVTSIKLAAFYTIM